ncbi:hypothetical protein NKH91_27930 [Mesorhizobium sp. M0894]|uniref:hypothetical protein n=1 Tax=unclassified Mesorhizobium TaxID=325217 RepID=UPI003334C0CE
MLFAAVAPFTHRKLQKTAHGAIRIKINRQAIFFASSSSDWFDVTAWMTGPVSSFWLNLTYSYPVDSLPRLLFGLSRVARRFEPRLETVVLPPRDAAT